MFAVMNFTIYRRDMQLEKNDRLMSCTPLATLETLGGKIITCTCSCEEIAGFKEEEYYYDDTKFVNSRLTVFSYGELTVELNLLGICIARDGQKRCCWRVLMP